MDKTLLDTDIFSEILKARDAAVAAKAVTYHAQFRQYTIASITVMEVVKGLHKLQQDERIQAFVQNLDRMEILAMNTEAAIVAGKIYADLERTGQPIGRADPMIAAIALENGLTLATGNTAHYARIQVLGYPLLLTNWRL